jgi:hypothetical protein
VPARSKDEEDDEYKYDDEEDDNGGRRLKKRSRYTEIDSDGETAAQDDLETEAYIPPGSTRHDPADDASDDEVRLFQTRNLSVRHYPFFMF